jgi:hypothetical protein
MRARATTSFLVTLATRFTRARSPTSVPVDLLPGALAISIADEGVIAALLRRPNGETLANLWVGGRLDIRNGTVFDVGRIRPKVVTRISARNSGVI